MVFIFAPQHHQSVLARIPPDCPASVAGQDQEEGQEETRTGSQASYHCVLVVMLGEQVCQVIQGMISGHFGDFSFPELVVFTQSEASVECEEPSSAWEQTWKISRKSINVDES